LTRAKKLDPRNLQVEMALIRLELLQDNFVGALNRSGKYASSGSPVCTKAPHAACGGPHF
jgi:hypothetical protein